VKAPLTLVVLATTMLAGCAANNVSFGLMNASSPEIPSRQIDKIDGTYKGAVQLVTARAPACPPSREGSVEIGDQTLYFGYLPNIIFIAPVQPDGTVHAVAGPSILDGRLTKGRLIFTVTTPVCQSRYDLRWVL
jgi:hypothetical protein